MLLVVCRLPWRPSQQATRYDHFESAVRQIGELETGVLECLIDPDLREISSRNDRFFNAVDSALREPGVLSKFALTPSEDGPAGPQPGGKRGAIDLRALRSGCWLKVTSHHLDHIKIPGGDRRRGSQNFKP